MAKWADKYGNLEIRPLQRIPNLFILLLLLLFIRIKIKSKSKIKP
ncbi:hypothetical protein QUF72_13265 [Desulfobacterales bacterium HSG2]|nr:hypothetical protein [Desulfobacterales bacterium HSG2]